MKSHTPTIHVGIFGRDGAQRNERHGCGLWPAGIAACLSAAEASPVLLQEPDGRSWDDVLDGLHGVVLVGQDTDRCNAADAEELCAWCHNHKFPILGIDQGLLLLNSAHGGTVYYDLPRDLPDALQHRHPPERGLRHAINVLPGTKMADLYGEGEVVVNSEHRRAVQRVARGFRVGAHALDGVIEAIESDEDDWFAVGVQWQPASATASGLDIQLFRGLVAAGAVRLSEEREGVLAAA
jgi:putative glutamine amidotransferase